MAEIEKQKDFAIIHDSPKGQILITKEPDGDSEIITLWARLEGDIGIAKLQLTIQDEDIADKTFEAYKHYEVAKVAINEILNQEYL